MEENLLQSVCVQKHAIHILHKPMRPQMMNDDNIRGNSLDEPNDCFAPINGVTGETEVD